MTERFWIASVCNEKLRASGLLAQLFSVYNREPGVRALSCAPTRGGEDPIYQGNQWSVISSGSVLASEACGKCFSRSWKP